MKPLFLFLLLFPFLSFSQGWTKLETTGSISSRTNASAIYHSERNAMFVFGGITNSGNSNELWCLDLNTNDWTQMPVKSVNKPAARFTHVAMYDSLLDNMMIWSGQGSTLYNDIWAYSFRDSTWSEIFPDGKVDGAPLKRYGTATVFDPLRRNIINFAGFTTDGRFDDTWVYSLTDSVWSDKSSSYHPLKRCLTSQCFAPERREMIVFGGQSTGNLNDVWTLNTDSYDWNDRVPDKKPAARHFTSAIYCGKDQVVIFGGDSLGQGDINGAMNDMWAFWLVPDEWKSVKQGAKLPSPRFGHTGVFIPQTEKILIFGGSGPSGLNKETWVFEGIHQAIASVNETSEGSVSKLSIFPNPSKGDAKLVFYLNNKSSVKINIYDAFGRHIAAHNIGDLQTGRQIVELFNMKLSPGFYSASVQAGNYIKSVKFVVE